MTSLDWLVLGLTLFGIVAYGVWKSRSQQNMNSYFLANRQLPWYQVGLSVMATQASAITFLSAPGQAFDDGIRFVQFYFGLPLAMVVLCVAFIPRFHNLKVFTAYEYLEKRFDGRTRRLTAFLFLLQRGLSTGITIYAPSLVLSALLQVDVLLPTIVIGLLVIFYTVFGGTQAVSYTQMLQMSIIFFGLGLAGFLVVHHLPEDVGFVDAIRVAGKLGKMNALDTDLDFDNRYNLWSGLIGGFFLQLSYFGTDQSQVGRYLTGKSITQSRLGLLMNGLLKIPMQFLILLIGILVFSFYQFNEPPLFFNQVEIERLEASTFSGELNRLKSRSHDLNNEKALATQEFLTILESKDDARIREGQMQIQNLQEKSFALRNDVKDLIRKSNPKADTNDTNYVFLRFVMDTFPVGIVGLLMAIIFLASMGSTASGLNSLASTTVVDFYKHYRPTSTEGKNDVFISRVFTLIWGVFCVLVALYASKLGNLIEAVNILGSLFYGTILGIFLVAFFIPKIDGKSVFWSAFVTEIFVAIIWANDLMAFLWLNAMGSLLVIALAVAIHLGRIYGKKHM